MYEPYILLCAIFYLHIFINGWFDGMSIHCAHCLPPQSILIGVVGEGSARWHSPSTGYTYMYRPLGGYEMLLNIPPVCLHEAIITAGVQITIVQQPRGGARLEHCQSSQ